VSPTEQKFVVHKTTLLHRSGFFNSICTKDWKEGRENSVRLPDADVNVFAIYIHYAYTGDLPGIDPAADLVGTTAEASKDSWLLKICKLWQLCDYLSDTGGCNEIVNRIIEWANDSNTFKFSTTCMDYIDENTTEGSVFRRLMVDIMGARISSGYLDKYWRDLPQDVLYALAKRAVDNHRAVGSAGVPSERDRCKYHVHEGGDSKCE
jgi:hypothetical protein